MLCTDAVSRRRPSMLLLYSKKQKTTLLPQDCLLVLHVFWTRFASMACCKRCVCLGLAPVARSLLCHFVLHFHLLGSWRRLQEQLHHRRVIFQTFDTQGNDNRYLSHSLRCFGAKIKDITMFLSWWSPFTWETPQRVAGQRGTKSTEYVHLAH